MKSIYSITLMFFILIYSNFSFATKNDLIFNQSLDTNICKNTYTFDLTGNINTLTAKQVTDYILNRKGICDVKLDVNSKKITLKVTDQIDIESLKDLIRYVCHQFLLDENHSETPEK